MHSKQFKHIRALSPALSLLATMDDKQNVKVFWAITAILNVDQQNLIFTEEHKDNS